MMMLAFAFYRCKQALWFTHGSETAEETNDHHQASRTQKYVDSWGQIRCRDDQFALCWSSRHCRSQFGHQAVQAFSVEAASAGAFV